MKVFINEVVAEWKPLRYFPKYIYSKENIKLHTKKYLTIFNKELVAIIQHLINSPFTSLVILTAIFAGLAIPNIISQTTLADVLSIAASIITGFISLMVAAAIFISTLFRQSTNKSLDEDMKFIHSINENKDTFMSVFDQLSQYATTTEKIILLKAAPADSVFDTNDYEKFKKWHVKAIKTIDFNEVEHYYQYLRFPYDTVMMTAYNRAYYMTEAASIGKTLLNKHINTYTTLPDQLKQLNLASNRYNTAGTRGYYIPTEFIGQRLYRVIVYSLVGLLFIGFSVLLKNYSSDIFPNININIVNVAYSLAVIGSIISIFLILRYIFRFVNYLKESSTYNTYSILNNIYIHEPDLAMRMNTNSYKG